MLIAAQIRAARFALRWSVKELSEQSGVSTSTIKRIEAGNDVPTVSARNLASIQSAFEAFGIEFLGSPNDAPGIRMHTRD